MKLFSRHSAFIFGASFLLAACDFGGNIGLENGKFTAEAHYNLRADGFVQETLDAMNDFATKCKGEVIQATASVDAGMAAKGVLEKLPADADVVFVIDTTGSMGWTIERVKTEVADAMKATPDRQYGVVIYRDRGDSYVSQTLAPLSIDVNAAIQSVGEAVAGEGGDYPESVAVGLDAGLNQPWRTDKEKHIILIGDAPDHEYPDGAVSMDSIAEKATAMGVIIHTIGVPCGDTCKGEIGAL
jgi:hypothetical protein